MFKHASMNRTYALVWNDKQQAYVPAPETARSRGKRAGTVIAAAIAGLFASGSAFAFDAGALPAGGRVIAGQAQLAQSGNTLTINQATAKAVIDWQNFNIGKGASVNFVQPSAGSIALNRVLGQDPTQIFGRLSANGQVFVVNPNGVLFGAGAQVSAAGIVASTREIGTADFMAGRLSFTGSGAGTVVNAGAIQAQLGGYVALIGAQIVNSGTITANGGDVHLAAADGVTLKIDGAGLASFKVDRGTLDGLVANQGLIRADGGRVFLTADALDQLAKAVVNNEGVIEARTVENRNGLIVLKGDMKVGSVAAGGILDASAPQGGDGGFVETSAAHVAVGKDARVTTAASRGKAGTWLIDPVDFTVASSGGDITGAQVSSALASGNLTIQSTSGAASGAGNINVNDAVSWSTNTLTLQAQRDINLNANLSGSGSAALALRYGQSAVAAGNTAVYRLASGVTVDLPTGSNFSTQLGSDGVVNSYYVINALGAVNSTTGTDLQGMSGDVSRNYALGSNLDASASINWSGGAGFLPVGNASTAYSGSFEGLGHAISQLRITRQADLLGLFGEIAAGGRAANVTLSAIGFVNGDTSTTADFGGIAGRNYGLIEHVRIDGGTVAGNLSVGGVVGTNAGIVRDARSSAAVGGNTAGGLIGVNLAGGVVEDSSASGNVSGPANLGGLIGANYAPLSGLHASGSVSNSEGNVTGGLIGYNEGAISNSYALGQVSGLLDTGGLIGKSIAAVSNSYATGAVAGSIRVGGLIGSSSAALSGSYATGNVSSGSIDGIVGGLVGLNSGTITNAYSTSLVAAVAQVGGLVGQNTGTIDQSHTGQGSVAGPIVTGTGDMTGGLVGNNAGTITNSQATGAVQGAGFTGGLAGRNDAVVSSSQASGAVNGLHNTGGLVGVQGSAASITSSSASGAVVATQEYIGGLVGWNDGTINLSSASNSVEGRDYVGGLVGRGAGAITDSQASGNVSGRNRVGGLVGHQRDGGMTRVSASGSVVGSADLVGGLAGIAINVILVDGASGTGTVTGHVQTGGLYGRMESGSVSGNSGASRTVSGTDSVGGLVGFKDQGTITNINIGGSVNGSGNYVGGLAGQQIGGSIDGSTASGNVSGLLFTGGLIGYNTGAVTSSSASGNVTGTTNVGGLIGENWLDVTGLSASGNVAGVYRTGGLIGNSHADVTSSHASGTVAVSSTNSGAGGLVGDSWENIYSSYATGAVTGFDYSGGLVGFLEAGKSITGSNASGVVQGRNYVGGLLGWSQNGTVGTSSASGNVSGTNNIGGLIGLTSSYYGHAIVSDSSATGNVSGVDSIGGLIGNAGGGSSTPTTSQNVSATGSVNASGVGSGGLIGVNSGQILTATASGAVTTSGSVAGGLVGSNSGTITTAQASGNVAGGTIIGGFVGRNESAKTITSATASGTVTASGVNAGGFAGINLGGISASQASGNVAGSSAVGGFVGTASTGTITASTAAGAVSGSSADIGGFVGVNSISLAGTGVNAVSASGTVTSAGGSNVGGFAGRNAGGIDGVSSSNTVTVTGSGSNVGGLVGAQSASATITHARALGTISATGSDDVGGLVGLSAAGSSIAYSYTANSIRGYDSVGGVVGSNAGSIMVAYASGAVRGHDRVGGFAGELAASGSATNVYASGAVSGNDLVGGFAGSASGGTVQYSYASGAVSGASRTGGYAGNSAGTTVSDSYFNLGTSGQAYANSDQGTQGALATGKSATQMQNAATFAGWDLSTTGSHDKAWRSYDGLASPLLTYWLTPLTITGTGPATSYVYNGNTHTDVETNVTYTATLPSSHLLGSAAYATGKDVGVYTLLAGHYSDQQGYDIVYANSGSITITPAPLNAAIAGVTKVYDGSTTAIINPSSLVLSGFIPGEGATATVGAATFNSKNVHDATTVAATLSGFTPTGVTLLGNYTLPVAATGSATITPKPMNATASAANKVYDGTRSAAVTLDTDDFVFGDSIGLTGIGTFIDKNVGTAKAVSVTNITTTGADAGNYMVIPSTLSASANITPKSITVAAAGVSRAYDGTVNDAVALSSSGAAPGDDLRFTATAVFGDKNVGTAKSIAVTGIAASGADVGNYTLGNSTASTSADITPAILSATLATTGKTYDGTTVATIPGNAFQLRGFVAGEGASVNIGEGFFNSKNVRDATTVSALLYNLVANGGTSLGNYQVPAFATGPGTIAPKPIGASATGVNKVYDGGTAAQVALTSADVLGGDVVTLTGNAAFADKNVGQGKAISVTGIVAGGADGGNYTLAGTTLTTSAAITPKAITVAATGSDKVYDGNTGASVTLASDDVVAGDAVQFSGSGSFANKNVGAAKAIAVGGIAGSGADFGNYTLSNTTASASAAITPATLAASLVGVTKTYDGTTAVQLTPGSVVLTGFVAGEGATVSAAAGTFNSKNVRDANLASAILAGGDFSALGSTLLGNYILPTAASGSASITPKAIAVSVSGADKVYDGNTLAQLNLSSGALVAGDVVSFSGTGSFSDKNVGSAKRIDISGIAAIGADAGNYAVTTTATASAAITARPLTVDLQGTVTKPADGGTGATLAGTNYAVGNVVGGESVTLSHAAGSFDSATAGTGKTVTVSLGTADYGAGAGTLLSNYVLYTGTVTGRVGVITGTSPADAGGGAGNGGGNGGNAISAPAALDAALASLPTNVSVDQVPATQIAVATAGGMAKVTAEDGAVGSPFAPARASAVSTNTRENLLFRRAFSIGDGGIRLPRGVQGSEKDAAQ